MAEKKGESDKKKKEKPFDPKKAIALIGAAVKRKYMVAFEVQRLKDEFKKVDKDGKGKVPLKTAREHIEKSVKNRYGDNPNMAGYVKYQLETQMERFKDIDGDGLVSQEEFLQNNLFGAIFNSIKFRDDDFSNLLEWWEISQWIEELIGGNDPEDDADKAALHDLDLEKAAYAVIAEVGGPKAKSLSFKALAEGMYNLARKADK